MSTLCKAGILIASMICAWGGAAEQAATGAPDLFSPAQLSYQAGDYAGALEQLRRVQERAVPSTWPRRYRHLLASAQFKLGQVAGAIEIWGELLCESRNDELAFPISYHLALAQRARGEDLLAYSALTALSPELVLKVPEPNRKQYFELVGQLASSLGFTDSAAAIYASALSALHGPKVARDFTRNFRAEVDRIRSADHLVALLTRLPPGPLRQYVQSKLRSNAGRIKRPEGDDYQIRGLLVQALAVRPVSLADGSATMQRLALVGKFRRPGWQLYCGGMRIDPAADGKFALTVDISEKTAAPPFFAVGPDRKLERHWEDYFMLDWTKFRAPASALALAPATLKEAPAGAATAAADGSHWRFFAAPALGVSYLAFQQPGVTSFDAASLQVHVSAGMQPAAWSWIFSAEVRFAPAQVDSSAGADRSHYLELGAEATHRWTVGSPEWLLDLGVGGTWVDLYGSSSNFGFRNAHAATLQTAVHWRYHENQQTTLRLRGGLFVDQTPLTINRREISVGLEWSVKLGWATLAPGIRGDFFHLESNGQVVSADQALIELAIGF